MANGEKNWLYINIVEICSTHSPENSDISKYFSSWWMDDKIRFSTTPEVETSWLTSAWYFLLIWRFSTDQNCSWFMKKPNWNVSTARASSAFSQVPRRHDRPPGTLCVPSILCGQGSELSFPLLLLYRDSPRLFHFGEIILDWFELLLLLLGIFAFSPLPGQRETRQTSQANFVGKLM